MKKVFAFALVVVLIMSFALPVFAYTSPGGSVFNEVFVNKTGDGSSEEDSEKIYVEEDSSLKIEPSKSDELEFKGFEIYTEDMKPAKEGKDFDLEKVLLDNGSEAKEGTDYEVKNGKIVSKNGKYLTIVIIPKVETLYVSDAFEGVDIEFNKPDGDKLSPETGVNMNVAAVTVMSLIILASAAMSIVSFKKIRG